MAQNLRWRIITGYSSVDYISIGEEELEKAKYAMVTGKVFTHGGDMIRGTEIKKIERDFRFYTGWNDTYKPVDSEDQKQMLRDMPSNEEFTQREKLSEKRVSYIMQTNKPDLLRDITKVDQLLIS